MSETQPKRGLGRGLSTLFSEAEREQPIAPQGGRAAGVQLVAVSAIAPHPGQPRRHFDEAALAELADSIAARGLIQPIVVRPRGDGYQIVAGERRWRAAQRAHLHQVPVIVRDFGDEETLEVALIENIQRAELNAIEEAEAYQRLLAEFGHSQDEVGKLVHKSRSHVANLMRLLDLPEDVRAMVADGRLTMGHARALITATDAAAIAHEVLRRGLSVRATEALVRAARPGIERKSLPPRAADEDIAALERRLGDMLGLRVKIGHERGAGAVSIAYSTLDQLDMICQRLSGEKI